MIRAEDSLCIHNEVDSMAKRRIKELMDFLKFGTFKDMQQASVAEDLQRYVVAIYQLGFYDRRDSDEMRTS